MKRRILSNMLAVVGLALVITTACLCLLFYNRLSVAMQEEVRQRALLLQGIVPQQSYSSLSRPDMRLTVISKDGKVLFDDRGAADLLPNHTDREEVKAAQQSGIGQSKRFSETLGQETYYCAVLLQDGSVLRLSKTTSSILGVFTDILPLILVVEFAISALCFLMAARLTKKIVDPINHVPETLVPPYDELAPFVKTIAAQRTQIAQQLTALQERAETIEAIMHNMSEGIVMVNRKGTVLTLNKSAASFFRLSMGSVGSSFQQLFRDASLIEGLHMALAEQRSEQHYSHGGRQYHAYFSPVSGVGAIVLFLDVTEAFKAETLRREFSANVSHELKTPLTIIGGTAEMLAAGMVKEQDRQSFYEKIQHETGRMLALITDILLISRLEEGASSDLYEQISLSEIAAEAVSSLTEKAQERGITVSLRQQPVTLCANRSQMQELLYNLLDNAIQYNVPNGKVSVSISEQEGKIMLSVADTGIGIPEESQERVFERFYRVDKSRSKRTGGTGLGLAIVKHIVLAYGGEIKLQSKVNVGTKIEISLPN